jgi:hypothetical protein
MPARKFIAPASADAQELHFYGKGARKGCLQLALQSASATGAAVGSSGPKTTLALAILKNAGNGGLYA